MAMKIEDMEQFKVAVDDPNTEDESVRDHIQQESQSAANDE